ncbi:hypothetical protein ACHAW5_011299 [Stephanodiscus triporus]|uniref:Uncharacterized protein n=1 Tax=Stephanodiscus triporus TaxID=2934178 RepID=A0ABD3MLF4_9STRA
MSANILSLIVLAHNTIGFRCASSYLPVSSIMSKRPAPTSPPSSGKPKKAKAQRSLSAFFGGAPKGPSDEATSTSSSSSSSSAYKIFCDLDGVLVDFEAGVRGLFGGRSPDELPNQSAMWAAIGRADRFYATLPWTEDGRALWHELKKHPTTPDILTGVPRTTKSRSEKYAWCVRELGGETGDLEINHVDMAGKKSAHELVSGRRKDKDGVVNVITCWSKNKHRESRRNHVLIDDRLSLREAWEEGGGIFIHHTNTERTLIALREKGVLGGEGNPGK